MVEINGIKYKRPAVVWDTETYVVLKFGEYEEMELYYRQAREAFSKIDYKELNKMYSKFGIPQISTHFGRFIELMELPLDNELVRDIVENISGLERYIGRRVDNVTRINFEEI